MHVRRVNACVWRMVMTGLKGLTIIAALLRWNIAGADWLHRCTTNHRSPDLGAGKRTDSALQVSRSACQ
jgi:hypothetical protein